MRKTSRSLGGSSGTFEIVRLDSSLQVGRGSKELTNDDDGDDDKEVNRYILLEEDKE
jgi:hypothetical protein